MSNFSTIGYISIAKTSLVLLLLSYTINSAVLAMTSASEDLTNNTFSESSAKPIQAVDRVVELQPIDHDGGNVFVRAPENLGDVKVLLKDGCYFVLQNSIEHAVDNAFISKEIRGFSNEQFLKFLFNDNYFFVKQLLDGSFSIEGRSRLRAGVPPQMPPLQVVAGVVIVAVVIVGVYYIFFRPAPGENQLRVTESNMNAEIGVPILGGARVNARTYDITAPTERERLAALGEIRNARAVVVGNRANAGPGRVAQARRNAGNRRILRPRNNANR